MRLIEVRNPDEAKTVAADLIQTYRPRVFGAATGATPELLYRELVDRRALDPSTTVCLLDEYIGLSTNHPQRYRHVIERQLATALGLSVVSPDVDADDLARACCAYDTMLDEVGGIDVQILGIGRNGHIAFNEPGTLFETATHVVELAATTRADNARFFVTDERPPTHAITQGIASIRRARHVILIATGRAKADAVAAMLDGPISTSVPATALRDHANVVVIADCEALAARAVTNHQRCVTTCPT